MAPSIRKRRHPDAPIPPATRRRPTDILTGCSAETKGAAATRLAERSCLVGPWPQPDRRDDGNDADGGQRHSGDGGCRRWRPIEGSEAVQRYGDSDAGEGPTCAPYDRLIGLATRSACGTRRYPDGEPAPGAARVRPGFAPSSLASSWSMGWTIGPSGSGALWPDLGRPPRSAPAPGPSSRPVCGRQSSVHALALAFGHLAATRASSRRISVPHRQM